MLEGLFLRLFSGVAFNQLPLSCRFDRRFDLAEHRSTVINRLEREFFVFDHKFDLDFFRGGGRAIDQDFDGDEFWERHP